MGTITQVRLFKRHTKRNIKGITYDVTYRLLYRFLNRLFFYFYNLLLIYLKINIGQTR